MKVTSAEFVKSAFDKSHWIEGDLPEIAFLGRSNVGKSSLINSLLKRKALARTSNTPGRTQSINFFLINSEFYFADLPGYGFAKVSKAMRSEWGKLAADYLKLRDQLVLSVQLVDSRHAPTSHDIQLFEWLRQNGRPQIIAATKSDKLSANKLASSLKVIRAEMPGPDIIACSSQTGKGLEAVWSAIGSAVNNRNNLG